MLPRQFPIIQKKMIFPFEDLEKCMSPITVFLPFFIDVIVVDF